MATIDLKKKKLKEKCEIFVNPWLIFVCIATYRKGVRQSIFFVFLFCDHFTIKGAKRLFEKMSLDHEVPGCLICKILAKRLGAHQKEGA